MMRRTVDAPNPTMDLLVADGLLTFAASSVRQVGLGSVRTISEHGSTITAGLTVIGVWPGCQKADTELRILVRERPDSTTASVR